MSPLESYAHLIGRIPKWALVVIMAIPVYAAFGYMAYNKEPTKQVVVGLNEVALVIDPDLTNCEDRGLVSEASSGCVLNRFLGTGIHGIPESHRIEIYSLEVQTFEWKAKSAIIKGVDDE